MVFKNDRNSSARWRARHSPMTVPAATSSAAKSVVVPLRVIMGHRPGTALFQGQTRLRAVECLDLALLIDGKHQRLLRWIDVKADDVLDLRDQVGIVGDLEAAHQMRLEAVFGPDALHARVADAHFS